MPVSVGIIRRMMPDPRVPHRNLLVFFWLLAFAAVANALVYAATTANWVPTSDNWFYLERVVYPYAHGHLELGDLLVKRGAFDHSQPLRRLLLLLNYEWFDLDFRIEAVFAVLVGAANILLLGHSMRAELRDGTPLSYATFAAIVLVYFSLSATIVFTWSLLTLSFTSHFFLLVWLLSSWAVLEAPDRGRMALLWASTFMFGLVSDDTALLAFIAGAMAAAIHAMRGDRWRGALAQGVVSFAGLATYWLFYRAWAPASAAGKTLHVADGLLATLSEAWRWVVVPLVAGLVHLVTLRKWFGAWAEPSVLLIAMGFVAAHLWFWKQAFMGTRNRTAYMATVLMLLFYGLVAGIIVGRVSEFGVKYLWQPRYAVIYRWHLLALLMMLVAQARALPQPGRSSRIAVFLVALLMALQIPLSISAWRDAKYIRRAAMSMAVRVEELANSTEMPRQACMPQLTVCKFDAVDRRRILGFLRDGKLSVFSHEVRQRNGYPSD